MRKFIALFAFAALAVFVVSLTSCETESVNGSISISPSTVQLEKDESATFTASGGYEYSWTLSDESLGILSSRSGASTTYTSRYDPGSNNASVIQILTVSSTIAGQNTSQALATAEAQIEHMSTPVDEPV